MNENYEAAMQGLTETEGMFRDAVAPQAALAQVHATLALVDEVRNVGIVLADILSLLKTASGL